MDAYLNGSVGVSDSSAHGYFASAGVDVPVSVVEAVPEQPPVKRGRGRPRTRPLPDPNAPKRKRGRPRKEPGENGESKRPKKEGGERKKKDPSEKKPRKKKEDGVDGHTHDMDCGHPVGAFEGGELVPGQIPDKKRGRGRPGKGDGPMRAEGCSEGVCADVVPTEVTETDADGLGDPSGLGM